MFKQINRTLYEHLSNSKDKIKKGLNLIGIKKEKNIR